MYTSAIMCSSLQSKRMPGPQGRMTYFAVTSIVLSLPLLGRVPPVVDAGVDVSAGEKLSASFPSCEIPTWVTGEHGGGGGPKFCYKRLCTCFSHSADCSKSRLTYIPKFNWTQEVNYVKFHDNNLTAIPDDFFRNVTQLRYVSLSFNQIKNISANAFTALENLKAFVMEYNFNLTHITMNPLFRVKTLQCVDISHGKLTDLPDALYMKSAMPELTYFYVGFNYLKVANFSRFEHLQKLLVLDWSGNTAVTFLAGRLKKIQTINLFLNRLYDFPDTCDVDNTPFFPNLMEINLRKNVIHAIPRKVCLPRLDTLDLSANSLQYLATDMFHPSFFPKLQNLYVESMASHLSIARYAFNNTSLLKVSLMFDDIKFSNTSRYSVDMLAGCPQITRLTLSHNFLSDMSDKLFLGFFGHLSQLGTLSMGAAFVGQAMITRETFASFPHLKVLQMYKNSVMDIPDGLFHKNPSLSSVQLNDNSIRVVRPSAFNLTFLKLLTSLDLSGNPFSCDCQLRWFSDWLKENSTLFAHSRSSYLCLHENGSSILDVRNFHMVEQACLLDQRVSQLIIFSIAFVLVLTTGVSTLYRYRWHLRLLLYEAFRGSGDVRRKRLQQGQFDYDVFVSYAHQDQPWVCQHLLPELEGRLELRLCIHERDFLVGNNIADNIVDSVNSSKKIVMVFSEHFVHSHWCQFELAYCSRYVMDYDDTLLVVCLGDVASRDMTSTMLAVLKTTTYLQWDENRDTILAFWGRLRRSLVEIAP